MKLAIVMPVLNEAETLLARLGELSKLRVRGVELVVVDGGSSDATLAILRSAGIEAIESPCGRARQMMTGAASTEADILMFLHADTTLPPDAEKIVHAALLDRCHAWGRFDVRIEGRPAMLRLVAFMMNLRSRLTGIATGDQAIFVTRQAFEAVGGFPDQALMEDIELSRRLRRVSQPVCLHQRVHTSGRRWETHGVWRTIVLMWQLRWAYWRGASPEELARRYR